jgi:hypothetical protein
MSTNFEPITQGCRKVFLCTFTGIVLTGATVNFEMRTSPPPASEVTSTAAILVKSTANDITITGATTLNILFDKADTNTLAVGSYWYGMEWIPSGETEPRYLADGIVPIAQGWVRGS